MTRTKMDAPVLSNDEERWAAVVRRDRNADGMFYYAVLTTGVYCRPVCAAKLARREHVRFHSSCEAAAGTTASYIAIAERIGSPNAVRALAHACASNSIAVAIPCHRVVRNDGALSGYRWGVERKRVLLERETIGSK